MKGEKSDMRVDPLKLEMVEARISQLALALELNLHQSQLNYWLNLTRPWPDGMRDRVAKCIRAHTEEAAA